MKKKLAVRRALFLVLSGACLGLWGCEEVEEDVAPVTFTNFKIHDDLLYIYNDKDSRVYSAVNDTVEIYDKITYSQPLHGEIYPNYANDVENIMGYKPEPGYVGLDSLTYEVCSGGTCKTAKVRFVVEARPDPSTCKTTLMADTLVTTKNTSKELRIHQNDEICMSTTSNWGIKYFGPANGTMRVMNYFEGFKNEVLIYQPKKNFVGEDTFTYRVYPKGWDGENADNYEDVVVIIIVK